MTASLMPPEVMDAINYASKQYVMLDELHHRVGERIATLVRAEAAMVTCGAASALTLGTAGVLTGTDRQKIGDLPNLGSMKSEVIIQKAHRFGYDRALRAGPGHLRDSATPGEPGNSVIVAHRDTFFRHVYELQKGDDILVRRNGQLFKYQVTGKKIVKPDDVSVLKQTTDPQLTLITCYPTYYIGPAPERLVVFSKLIAQTTETQAIRPAGN